MSEETMHNNELKAIIASAYYLATEARKAGLNEVSLMFRRVIADIDTLIKSKDLNEGACYKEILDCDLFKIMEILNKAPVANKLALQEIIDTLEDVGLDRKKSH